ncbi:hypothetical protein Bca101_075165 [Brassica carinata]
MKTIGRVDVPQEAFKLKKEEELSCRQDWYVSSSHYRAKAPFMSFLTSDVVSLEAIQIINLPKDLEKDTIHCYNSNGFKLHRVPVPRPGKVLELQSFIRIVEEKLKCYEATICGCYEKIPKGTLGMVLEKLDERGMMSEICDAMDLNHLLDREATQHDLSVLDYLSDFVCCLYGKPTAYGVVTLPFSVREGINVFLSGFVPSENLRFRDESLNFKVSDKPQESEGKVKSYAR